MRKLIVDISPIDLDQTLGCGQTFRWRRQVDGSYRGPLGDQLVTLSKKNGTIEVIAEPGRRDVDELVRTFLRADDDVRTIQRTLGGDAVLARGIRRVRGLRIVKFEEWECLGSYVLATYANIPRISKMIETLANRYGTEIAHGIRTFPDRARLAEVSAKEFKKCGLGYRAEYLEELCRIVDQKALSKMTRMSYPDLREKLLELPGVGEKVADCVALFGFGNLESFPIDIWIERALARLYGKKGTYRRLREFANERFGRYAGYAQEYLYFNERLAAPRGECLFVA